MGHNVSRHPCRVSVTSGGGVGIRAADGGALLEGGAVDADSAVMGAGELIAVVQGAGFDGAGVV